jgi:hypothetical protein
MATQRVNHSESKVNPDEPTLDPTDDDGFDTWLTTLSPADCRRLSEILDTDLTLDSDDDLGGGL